MAVWQAINREVKSHKIIASNTAKSHMFFSQLRKIVESNLKRIKSHKLVERTFQVDSEHLCLVSVPAVSFGKNDS